MSKDIHEVMSSCSTCAQANRHLPAGKLMPLENPHWSHIVLDFLTDLPESESNIVILFIIDHFSWFLKLIPLTALLTAEVIFNHMFRYFGLPDDIMSDGGPTHRKEFMEKIRKTSVSYVGFSPLIKWSDWEGKPRTKRRSSKSSDVLHQHLHHSYTNLT